MKTLEDVLEDMGKRIDRQTVEQYVSREWLRPVKSGNDFHFEAIDVARLELVYHLTEELNVNEDAMDIVLSLLDQLYGMRAHAGRLSHAISRQPEKVQSEIRILIQQLAGE